MASAVLSNRNEPNWPQHRGGGAGFMGKLPFSNSNPNLNPNPKLANTKRTQSASDDAYSINRRPKDANHSQYVTFNVTSYSKRELSEFKNRLLSDLEQIRNLKNRIESCEFQQGHGFNAQRKKPTSKKISGNKRPLQLNSAKELKRSHSEVWNWQKDCAQLLQKLMKHKHGWIFNTPVDPVAMELHDYFDIIKRPMDLGTVKSNLSKHMYSTPMEFASDVQLTFNNALTYNPKGHEVYSLADELSVKFDRLFPPLLEKFDRLLQQQERDNDEELQASSWNHVAPERVKKKENDMPPAKLQREQLPPPRSSPPQSPVPAPASSSNPPLMQSPARSPSTMRAPPVKPVKQPKPKAKDPNKREMSVEEKQKLGIGLQSLPPEKMEQVVQIIRKRNEHLAQEDDEIELDMESVDTETLWELDRLVTNWKKMMSKLKRQALLDNLNNNVASNKNSGELPVNEKADVAPVEMKKPKKVDAGDEDVDIGDEMPMSVFPPVEIEKDKEVVGGHASSSSSSSSGSSSDSSSSSDSDSGSSSGSDSEADNGHL